MINRITQIQSILISTMLATLTIPAMAVAQDSTDAQKAEAAVPAVVVTSEGWVERCILPLVITSVDGEAVEDDAGRYEFEAAGRHSFSGYAQGDFTECATIADAGLGADSPIGEGSATIMVPGGKSYYLGLDVRKSDPSTWKVVTWRIDH